MYRKDFAPFTKEELIDYIATHTFPSIEQPLEYLWNNRLDAIDKKIKNNLDERKKLIDAPQETIKQRVELMKKYRDSSDEYTRLSKERDKAFGILYGDK